VTDLANTLTQLTTRPITVSYLVSDGDCTQLDKIFAECYGRWSGRESLVVPVSGDHVDDDWLNWLTYADPDLIYSFCDLSDDALKEIDRRVMPAFIHRGNADHHSLQLDLNCLSSLSTVPEATAIYPDVLRPQYLLDANPDYKGDGFLSDSFGFASRSTISSGTVNTIRPLLGTAVTKTEWSKAAYNAKADLELDDELALLDRMSGTSIITMSQLSGRTQRNRRDVESAMGKSPFNIFVGDDFRDRVGFWNSRHLQSPWLGRAITSVRIPTSRLSDESFRSAFAGFLQKRMWTIGNNAWATVRSSSVSREMLDAFAAFLVDKTHLHINVDTNFEYVPTLDAIKNAEPFVRPDIKHLSIGRQFSIPWPTPKHLGASANAAFMNQQWAVDLRIGRNSEPGFVRDHWWELPRKWTLIRPFLTAGGSPAKVSRTGELRLYGSATSDARIVTLPESDDAMLRYAFFPVPHCMQTTDMRHHLPTSEQLRIEYSDKGRYLLGTVRLFNGIGGAYTVLADRYWQSVLLGLSAPAQNRDDATHAEMLRRLKKKLKRGTVSSDKDWLDLADAISKIAPKLLKAPDGIISFRDLLKARRHDIKSHPGENITYNRNDLEESVERRAQSGVLNQGLQWRCWRCYHYNWTSLGATSQSLTCVVCGAATLFPPRVIWDFQINEFLANALREHGTLALIWCLGFLHRWARADFLYTAPLDVYVSGLPSPYTDVDICCVLDGRLVIGEAKEKGRNFDDTTIDKLARVARAISADVVLLACLELAAKPALEALAKKLAARLSECEVRVMTPGEDFGSQSSSWLP